LQLGSTLTGLNTKDGVVLAGEKRVTSLLLVIASSRTNSFLFNYVIDNAAFDY
jgi:20S proteasome alpha/beta subunit